MKIFNRLVIIVFILLFLGIVFRGWLYRSLITYKALGERTNYEAKSLELIKFIEVNTKAEQLEFNKIVKCSLDLTSKSLHFTNGRNDIDPNTLINTRSAHCIGYAAFMSTVCNQMFEKDNLSSEWIAIPQKGQLYFMGRNIHPYFKAAFFKDHDFVIIRNLKTGEEFGVDPTLYDYTGIKYITLKN